MMHGITSYEKGTEQVLIYEQILNIYILTFWYVYIYNKEAKNKQIYIWRIIQKIYIVLNIPIPQKNKIIKIKIIQKF